MRTAKKAILLVLCAALLVTASIMGTLAYLTYKTETITNTMTVGQVKITLDEAKVDEYGQKLTDDDAGRVSSNSDAGYANTYKLIPGHTYTKDPTIHVTSGSEACWLFVKVENGIEAIEDKTTIAEQMTVNGWKRLEVDDVKVENVWYKETSVDARTTAVDVEVFESFKILGTAEISDYRDKTISVTAYAVQADGFDSAAAAWDATFGATNDGN